MIRTHRHDSWGYLAPAVEMLPRSAQRAGYATAIIGKWHLGLESPNTPTERGFEHFHGYLGDMMDDYYDHRRHGINYMRLGTQEIDLPGHATDLFGQWTIDYLNSRRTQSQPFFVYLAFNAPHSPIQPPVEWLQQVKERENSITDKRAAIVALIEHMDDTIGRVFKALEANGLANNTIVVFTSDNGGSLKHGGKNGALRGGKGTMYEGGLKVPTAVVWPKHIAAGSHTNQAALTMDILPTLFDAANVKYDELIEGHSFLPTLLGKKQLPLRNEWFFVRREGGFGYGGKCIDAVRQGPWKLLQNSPFKPRELYNLDEDPLEQTDLITKRPKVAARLSTVMRLQIQRAGAIPWMERPTDSIGPRYSD